MRMAETWAIVNLIVCSCIFWSCMCRLEKMGKSVPKRVRAQFVLTLVGSVASGLQPMLFAQWPGVGQTLFSGSVLMCLLLSMDRWRHGPPNDLTMKG